MRIKVFLCLVAMLCAAPSQAKTPGQSTAPQMPVWLSTDNLGSKLHIGEHYARILGDRAMASDIDLDAGVVCLRTENDLWIIDLQRKTYEHALSLPPNSSFGSPRQSIVASGLGQCAVALDKDRIGIFSEGKLHTTQLVSSPAGNAGELVQLQYVQATHQFLIVTDKAYALIPANKPPELVKLMMPHGTAKETHFSNFRCCSVLSNDGRTLFASAQILNNDDKWQYAVARIDARNGKYLGYVLPMRTSYPESPQGYIAPTSDGKILLTEDGQWLYTGVLSDWEPNTYAIAGLNLRTRELRLFPSYDELVALSPLGKELITQQETIPRTIHLVNASNGELLRSSPDEVSSVAHGNGGIEMLESASTITWLPSPKRVLECKDLGNTITDSVLNIADSAPNADIFMMYVGDFSIHPKPAQCQTTPLPIIQSGEALAFIKSRAASFDASKMPVRPAEVENTESWQNYKNTCHEQAKDKAGDAKAYEAYCLSRLVVP